MNTCIVTHPAAWVRIRDEDGQQYEALFQRGQEVEADAAEVKRVNRGDWKQQRWPALIPKDDLAKLQRETLNAELEAEEVDLDLDDAELGGTDTAPDDDPDPPESSVQQALAALAAAPPAAEDTGPRIAKGVPAVATPGKAKARPKATGETTQG